MTGFNLLAPVFSPQQIVIIVITCVAVAALIGLNIALFFILRRRGERRLCTHQLQKKREELLERLEYIKHGGAVESRAVAGGGAENGVEASDADGAAEEQPAEASAIEVGQAAFAEEPDDTDDSDTDDDDDEDADEETAGENTVEVAEESEEPDSAPDEDILAVREASAATREILGFVGEEYDRKQYYVRYTLGFEAKLREADEEVKERYKAFVNELALYKGVKLRSSFRQQRITRGKKTLGLIMMRGKTLCVAFALNPADYADTKYRGIDKSDKKRFADTPMLCKLTSDRRLVYAKYLFLQLAEKETIVLAEKPVMPEIDLSEKTRDELFLEKKLRIKILGEAPDLETDAEESEEEEVIDEIISEDGQQEVRIIYNRSFTARIIQANDDLKARYSELKNYLLSYEGVSDKASWKRETFRYKGKGVAAFAVTGKTLCLYLAIEPAKFIGTKYAVEDMSSKRSSGSTPSMYRIKGDRRTAYAKQLIDIMFGERGAVKFNRKSEDYTQPYKSTAALVRRGLIREEESKLPFISNKKPTENGEVKEKSDV